MPFSFQTIVTTVGIADSIKVGGDKTNANFANIQANGVTKDGVISSINASPETSLINSNRIAGIPANLVNGANPVVTGDITITKPAPSVIFDDTAVGGVKFRWQVSGGAMILQKFAASIWQSVLRVQSDGLMNLLELRISNSGSRILERCLYWGDETEKSTTSTSPVVIKQSRLYRGSGHGFKFNRLYVIAEIRSSSGGTTTLQCRLGGSTISLGTTTGGAYTVISAVIDITVIPAFADPSLNLVEFLLHTSAGSSVAFNRTVEVYVE